MIYSRKYSRNFIPLKQDSTKHTLDFRPAIGKCLIEIKDGEGKINFYAQGIKPNLPYRLEMIGFDKGELKNAYFGDFKVDEHGKGELRVKFNPDNVAETKRSIENFNVVSLMADNQEDLSCALIGYIGNEIPWKDKYKKSKLNSNKKYQQKDKELEKELEKDLELEKNKKLEKDLDLDKYKDIYNQKDTFNNKTAINNIDEPCNNEFFTKKEQGLIDKKQGLVEREKGLIEKEKGLIDKENSEELFEDNNLNKFKQDLQDKENGLIQKEKGLLDKEKALLLIESELNSGNIPKEDTCVRDKEISLIQQEQLLIKQEQDLIKQEREIIRKKLDANQSNNTNAFTATEEGLIQREQGLLDREQGLLDKEKGRIEKEKGLFEVEKSLRYNNNNNNNIHATQADIPKSIPENTNHDDFKNMIDKLKRNISKISDLDNIKNNASDINNIQDVNMSDNNIEYSNDIDTNTNSNNNNYYDYSINDINYIKFNNAKMTPFKDFEEDIMWYRISPYELNSLTDKAWVYSNNPFILTCYKKYSHLMLGINDNNTDYILALPCKYDEKFKLNSIFDNFKDFSKLSKFVPINNNLEENTISNNDYGYMVINL